MIPSTQEILLQLERSPLALQFVLIAVSSAFTEEVAVIGVLGLVRAGKVSEVLALLAIFVGTLVMNIGLYLCGRFAGKRALGWGVFRKFRENGTIYTLHKHVDKEGWVAVAIARFVPGTRLPIFVLSGILGMEWHKFVLSIVISTILWMIAALGLFHVAAELGRNQPWLLGALALAVIVAIFVRIGRKRS